MLFARKVVAGFAAIIAVVLGLGLATAGSAAAADGTWRPYGNTNPITSSASTWKCGDSESVAYAVVAQVCVVKAPSGNGVQGAVIVRNNRSSLFGMNASVSLYRPSGSRVGPWECSRSGVGANSWSVCFGTTIPYPGPTRAGGSANNASLDSSPFI